MSLTIVTEPAAEPVSVADINDFLRLTGTGASSDTVIAGLITAARRYCEQVQGRAYIDQTLRLTLDGFPGRDYIELPRSPVSTVASVTYYSTGNTAATMTAANYFVDTASTPARVHLAYGEVWPSETLRPANGVVVQYTAGYGSAATSVPQEVKQAIKLLVGHFWENREATTFTGTVQARELPLGVESLLWLERVVSI